MYAIAIQKIGDSFGITLPPEILEKLQVGEGDTIFITETAEGIEITTRDTEFEKAMEIYKKGSEKYKNALRKLAK